MKKTLLYLFVAVMAATLSCKKDNTCWVCQDQSGTDIETCSSAEYQEMKDQGFFCTQK